MTENDIIARARNAVDEVTWWCPKCREKHPYVHAGERLIPLVADLVAEIERLRNPTLDSEATA